MKISSVWVCAFLLIQAASLAAERTDPLYLTLDAGANLMSKVQHPATALTLSMETGARFDASFGVNFVRNDIVTVGGELEVGMIYNGINHGTLNGARLDPAGYLFQVPGLINARASFVPNSAWRPYIGIGGGAVRSTLALDGYPKEDEYEPAAQGMAGLLYDAGDVVSVGIGYKFLMTWPDQLRRVTNHAATIVLAFDF